MSSKMIGICGNIGAGKTKVASIFKEMGVPVLNCDMRANELLNSNRFLMVEIEHEFGPNAYCGGLFSKSKYNRTFIASVVFSDKKKLERLNSIVYPYLKKAILEWNDKQDFGYTLIESFFELDFVEDTLLVTAPEEVRVARVKQRDNRSAEQIQAIIDNQEKYNSNKFDYVINNNGINDIKKVVKDFYDIFNYRYLDPEIYLSLEKINFPEYVKSLNNDELFKEYEVGQMADDYDGCFTKMGAYKRDILKKEFVSRLIENKFLSL